MVLRHITEEAIQNFCFSEDLSVVDGSCIIGMQIADTNTPELRLRYVSPVFTGSDGL